MGTLDFNHTWFSLILSNSPALENDDTILVVEKDCFSMKSFFMRRGISVFLIVLFPSLKWLRTMLDQSIFTLLNKTTSIGCKPWVQWGGRIKQTISFSFISWITLRLIWALWPSIMSKRGRLRCAVVGMNIWSNQYSNEGESIHPSHVQESYRTAKASLTHFFCHVVSSAWRAAFTPRVHQISTGINDEGWDDLTSSTDSNQCSGMLPSAPTILLEYVSGTGGNDDMLA